MVTLPPLPALSILTALAETQHLALVEGAWAGPMLEFNWIVAGRAAGLRGMPQNRWNGLVQHSRLIQASMPAGGRCMGLLFRDRPEYGQGELYLAASEPRPAALRLEMPPALQRHAHVTDPLTDEGPTLLHVFTSDNRRSVRRTAYVRLRDLWMDGAAEIRRERVGTLAADPAQLAAWGGLKVTRAFETDVRWAPSPWARFVLGREGIEEAAAVRALGMEWIAATENPEAPPRDVFSHHPF